MTKKLFGQQAIEFVLISSLVLIGALATTLTFGDKIASFFENDSAIAKTSKAKSGAIKSNSSVAYTPDFKSSYSALVDNPEMSKYNVIQNSDGSVSFTVGTQNVNLPANIVQLQDTVMQTTGSSGSTELINEIANIISSYKSEYPSSPVPVSISYGQGDRQNAEDPDAAKYIGTATANSVTIKTGKHLTILQKDQKCVGSACDYPGLYKIKGTIDSSNRLKNTTVDATLENGSKVQGLFSGDVDLSSGIKISKAYFQLDGADWSYNWDIDCSASDKQFNI